MGATAINFCSRAVFGIEVNKRKVASGMDRKKNVELMVKLDKN